MVIDKPDNLQPQELLMYEHRVIESMISFMKTELSKVKKEKKINPFFIEMAVDFFRVYADMCHHGKEENIFFRELKKKKISSEHKKILRKLISQHVFVRQIVDNLVKAKKRYIEGNEDSIDDIESYLMTLTRIYPEHIKKEEREFFKPAAKHFSEEELDKMKKEFFMHDRDVLHEKYGIILDSLK